MTRSQDVTIYDTFHALGIPREVRHDVYLFVAIEGFLKTAQGRKAANDTNYLPAFESMMGEFDEKVQGHWSARDHAMRVLARHTATITTGLSTKKPKKKITKKQK